ncbi:hypothetical protein ACCO45_009954 [Purpureocillium lilacinum]|uniref:Uncharacterized protein n=1 Tax=Purpureocillium lilacinum TaxID=33203 RepID=A0ACC4DDG4_PURLI
MAGQALRQNTEEPCSNVPEKNHRLDIRLYSARWLKHKALLCQGFEIGYAAPNCGKRVCVVPGQALDFLAYFRALKAIAYCSLRDFEGADGEWQAPKDDSHNFKARHGSHSVKYSIGLQADIAKQRDSMAFRTGDTSGLLGGNEPIHDQPADVRNSPHLYQHITCTRVIYPAAFPGLRGGVNPRCSSRIARVRAIMPRFINGTAAAGIASAVESCFESYRDLDIGDVRPGLDQNVTAKLKDQHDRLAVWARNVKAHLAGPGSLDHRLRDASPIKTLILDLLDEKLATGGSSEDDGLPVTELEQIAMDIAEVVDNLLQLGNAIQTPAQHDFLVAPRVVSLSPARDDFELAVKLTGWFAPAPLNAGNIPIGIRLEKSLKLMHSEEHDIPAAYLDALLRPYRYMGEGMILNCVLCGQVMRSPDEYLQHADQHLRRLFLLALPEVSVNVAVGLDPPRRKHLYKLGSLLNVADRPNDQYIMASPKRSALLVGIDLYMNDCSRKSGDGESFSLGNLRGCVNDVQAVAKFLRDEFQLEDPRILTSSLNPSSLTYPTEPTEPSGRRPTFDNIKREFKTLIEQAGPGDLVLFHFSGHGARLQPTSKSPAGRLADPSLLTMDFGCGKPAVRGWQLNEWLKRLNEKKVRTIVILDSCHSGGAFRSGGNFRTPEGWTNIPNLPADEEAITETAAQSGSRDAQLETSWSINPDGFTVMTACESQEKAAEKNVNGIYCGAFTHGLLACLKQNRPTEAVVTYRHLHDQIVKRVNGQTPRRHHSSCDLKERKNKLPIGGFHGVQRKAEFTTYPPTSNATFSVDEVDDWECSAPVSLALHAQNLQECHYQIIPCRWSLGDDTLQVDWIVGDTEITQAEESHEPESNVFKVVKCGNDCVDLAGSPSLIGYEGPVRGLDLTGVNTTQLAVKSAAALAHLTRFRHILSLSGNASQLAAPFDLTLEMKGNRGQHDRGQDIGFLFKNITESELHLTVLALSPSFKVKQFFPTQDLPALVNPGREVSFTFNTRVPDALKNYSQQREIIRAVVTRGKRVSWKSLELPDIWNADEMADKRRAQGETWS